MELINYKSFELVVMSMSNDRGGNLKVWALH